MGVMMKGMTTNLGQPAKTARTVLEDSVTSMRVVTDTVSYVLTSTLLSNVIMMGFQRRVLTNVAMYVSRKTAQEELYRQRNQLSCIFTVPSQPCMAKLESQQSLARVGSLLLPVRLVSPPYSPALIRTNLPFFTMILLRVMSPLMSPQCSLRNQSPRCLPPTPPPHRPVSLHTFIHGHQLEVVLSRPRQIQPSSPHLSPLLQS